MNNKTILYVSSNRESPGFERRIKNTLILNCRGLPIVSVTQKSVDLGININVGDVGVSGFNFCRQILIGLKEVKTEYVISAESDCIYPPDYFMYTPKMNDVPYRNKNIYVQKYSRDYVCKKKSSTFAQIIGRKFYIKRLENLLEGQPEWNIEMKNFPKEINKPLFNRFKYFQSKNPCISFKTGRGMRKHSNTDETPIYKLPYWGPIKSLRKQYE